MQIGIKSNSIANLMVISSYKKVIIAFTKLIYKYLFLTQWNEMPCR